MNLENMTKVYARSDSRIQLKVIPGHFVTSQSHIHEIKNCGSTAYCTRTGFQL